MNEDTLVIKMKQRAIKYFTYYGCNEPLRKRVNSPAADTKVDYIIEVLNRCGYTVELVSHAISATGHYIPAYVEKKGINTIRYYTSFGASSILGKVLNRLFVPMQFFLWGLFNIERGEQVIVYHSIEYDFTFLLLKKLKSIRYIGEIEEIYQDVHSFSKRKCKNEYKFISSCEKMIYPNTILNERLNPRKHPYIVIHGIYKVAERSAPIFDDGKIHILYAGTFDPVKGGAVASIKAARFLSENYHLHITGFGTDQQEEEVVREYELAKMNSKCILSYHGYLDMNQFSQLMQGCQIGLCTQDPGTKLNLTSFPSKILNYMSHGLVVLSGRNRAIEESAVGDIMYYYEKQSPEVLAQAIMDIPCPSGSLGMQRLRELDRKLELQLGKFIEL